MHRINHEAPINHDLLRLGWCVWQVGPVVQALGGSVLGDRYGRRLAGQGRGGVVGRGCFAGLGC
jgi:hypothetical protein